MKKRVLMLMAFACVLIPAMLFAYPTVYPTGTTIYNYAKCWNGYTVISTSNPYPDPITGKMVMNPIIDMNGNEVHNWAKVGKGKLLPGGHLLGAELGSDALVQVDWDGNIAARWAGYGLHHDQQKQGNPVGYYAPGMQFVDKGTVLILGNITDTPETRANPGQADQRVTEVAWDGKIVWDWKWRDHYDDSPMIPFGDNRLFNAASWLGPNKWYDAGDERFHPENVIVSAAYGDRILIISKKTGRIVWNVGPDFSKIPQLAMLGYPKEVGSFGMQGTGAFVGGMLHHAHMIPKGLPGEGNIMVFNNGKPFSLVTEFDPVALKIVWEYSGPALGYAVSHSWAITFYSGSESSAQRLPNGNTLICEADTGRIFEVTKELEIVWEYVNPRMWKAAGQKNQENSGTYRAYRVPYDWIPQLPRPAERDVIRLDNTKFNVEPYPAVSNTGSFKLKLDSLMNPR